MIPRRLTLICCIILASVLKSSCGQETSLSCNDVCGDLADRVVQLEAKWAKLASLFSEDHCPDTPEPELRQCYKGMAAPGTPARVQTQLNGDVVALCDTLTDGGGWIVIQRRTNGEEDFYRDWQTYKNGFGQLSGDYWLGNEIIHALTTQGPHELRVDMEYEGTMYYAQYSTFAVGDEASGYKLALGSYNGTAADSLTYHNNMKFSTYDRDNDTNSRVDCAELNHGGWWYKGCRYANLNGLWGANSTEIGGYLPAVYWGGLTPQYGPYLSFTEMKIRRL